MNVREFLSKYDSPKLLTIVSAGCGFSLAEILSIPGASKCIDGIMLPYSKVAVSDIAGIDIDSKFVSKEYLESLLKLAYLDNNVLAITGAITTNRYRRGDNEAYIGYDDGDSRYYYHLLLDKMTEEEHAACSFEKLEAIRKRDDIRITSAALSIVLGQTSNIKGLTHC